MVSVGAWSSCRWEPYSACVWGGRGSTAIGAVLERSRTWCAWESGSVSGGRGSTAIGAALERSGTGVCGIVLVR